jgi:hypothetical protein
MGSFIMNFQSALSLLDWAEVERQKVRSSNAGNISPSKESMDLFDLLTQWQNIAFRDGAMSIWHFYHSIEGIKKSLNLCKSLHKTVKDRKMDGPINKFKMLFPGFKKIRHAVAHAGENHQDAANSRKNSISGAYEADGIVMADTAKNASFIGFRSGRKYQHTYQGEMVSYELSHQSLSNLVEIQEMVFATFRATQ